MNASEIDADADTTSASRPDPMSPTPADFHTLSMLLARRGPAGADGPAPVELFHELLEQHPDALVSAFASDGLTVEMPGSVPLTTHRVVQVRSVLDLVEFSDKATIIGTWERVRLVGGGAARIHLVNAPERAVYVFAVDALEQHGVHLAMIIAAADQDARTETLEAPVVHVGPRVARVRKDVLAVITHIDAAATQMLGWEPDEMIGRRSLEFIHPDDQDRSMSNWLEMLTAPGEQHRVRLRHQTATGSWMWIEITNHNLLEDPHHGCVLAEMMDISEELAAQEALRASEQLLRRLAESLPVGVVQIEPDRRIVYANGRLSTITGAPDAATIAEQFRQLIDDDLTAFEVAVDDVLTRGDDRDLRIRFLDPSADSPDGVRHCTVSMRSLTSDDNRITGAVLSVADVSEQVRLHLELEQQATFDPLTGCYNRRSVIAWLERCLVTPPVGVSIVFIDLDGFKEVNDEFGHAAGDDLLARVAQRLRGAVRDGDVVGRVGGDEFLVVCNRVDDLVVANQLARDIQDAFAADFQVGSQRRSVRASVGVAQTCDPSTSSDQLVAEADANMYVEKRERRRRTRRADDIRRSEPANAQPT